MVSLILEVRIAGLHGITVGIGNIAAELTVVGTYGLGRVAQLGHDLSHGKGEGYIGVHVVIGAALFSYTCMILVIGECYMLIACTS